MLAEKKQRTIDDVAYELELADQALATAKAFRENIFNELLAMIPAKEEGTEKTQTQSYRIATAFKVKRDVDQEALEDVRKLLMREVIDSVFAEVTDLRINTRALKEMAVSNPESYKLISKAIIVTPQKPSIKIERIEN